MKKQLIILLSAIALLISVTSCNRDPYENSIYSEQPVIGLYQDYLAENTELPSEGVDPVLKTGLEKGSIKKSGLFFKDSSGNGKLDVYEDWRQTPRERATDLVSQMSTEEKLGLFNWLGNTGVESMTKDDKGTEDAGDDVKFFGITGINADGSIEETIVGSMGPGTSVPYSAIVNGARYATNGPKFAPLEEVKYHNNLQGMVERAVWGIPFIVSHDPAHIGWDGDQMNTTMLSKWPYYLGLGSADDLKTTKAFGETVAREMRMLGRNMMLGPQADIATEPRWARIQHTIHSNGDAAAKHMKVLIQAMQGGKELKPWGMATTVKHIPGAGSDEEGMDSHTAAGQYSVFPGNNIDEHLKPFQAALDAGAVAVMSAYSIVDVEEYKDVVNGKPVDEGAAFSTKIMTDLLRTKMGFDGSVVSDWGIGEDSAWGHENITGKPEILAEMFNAGTYQYGGKDFTDLWKEAYEFELITDEKIDEAAIRTLEIQFKLGLFENPYVNIAEAEAFWDPNGKAMRKRIMAGENAMKKAMVLTENSEVAENTSLLPISGPNPDYINGVDINGNGQVDVYFDSAYPEADSGQAKTQAFSTDTQYLNINFVDDITKADIAIVRVFSRGATYFGTLGGTPLSYDAPVRVWDHEKQEYTDQMVPQIQHMDQASGSFTSWIFDDWSNLSGPGGFLGQGFQTYLGAADSKAAIERTLAAKKANPGLKVIVGMTDSRPGIVSDFVEDVDAMIIDFAATDNAFLDVVFFQDGNKPEGRLPVEIPSDDASVEAQLSDVPGDTANPTYEVGYGLNYPSIGGYGS